MDADTGSMAVISSPAATQMKKAIRKALAGTLNKLPATEIQNQCNLAEMSFS